MNTSELGHANFEAYPGLRDSILFGGNDLDFMDLDEW